MTKFVPSRTGVSQNLATRLASVLNYQLRCVLGLKAQLSSQQMVWVPRHAEYNKMSQERKQALIDLLVDLEDLKVHCKEIEDTIRKFHTLPIYTSEVVLERSRKRNEANRLRRQRQAS